MLALSRKTHTISPARVGHWLGVLAGMWLSPGKSLLPSILSAYLPGVVNLQHQFSIPALLEVSRQLDALSPTIMLTQLLPLLILCFIVSVGFLYLCSLLGKAAVCAILQKHPPQPE